MKNNRIYYYLFFFSLVVDFKGAEEGGSFVQLLLYLIALVSGVTIIVSQRLTKEVKNRSKVYGYLLISIAIISFVYILFLNIEIGKHIRVALPFYFLILGYFVGIRMLSIFRPQDSILLMIWSSMSAIIFNLFYGFMTTGVGLDEIRYQILSPMMFVAIPGLCYYAFVLRHNILLNSSLLFAIVLLIVIAATRSWLIAFLGIVTVAVFYKNIGKVGAIRSIFGSALLITVAFALAGTLLYLASPDSAYRMLDRFFVSDQVGFDITSATRLAEIEFQLDAWLTNARTFLFGNGVGAMYGFSGMNAELVFRLLGNAGVAEDWWFAGHNFWVYSLFSQGILLGAILPVIFVRCFFISIQHGFVKDDPTGEPGTRNIHRDTNKFLSLVFISFLLATIGGNPMGSRMLGQFLGVCIGLLVTINAPRKSTSLAI